ncbi:hypothetical protein Bealeia1_01951 (plasmid) [Candidatus Bealeia paramacronuclearis]|uniref:Uncharacterized protein n=1 Tax=Candidatus Bealeia paramacronuclearis TaxID=1921001 RepID=A0ABZ2C5G3_9PROT|nr:hypothetical protein [Candidatus Bealeia paramacronuclearis]MEB3703403.1 hypothetical protein [Candidatus Bealeia paramacronuclearis]
MTKTTINGHPLQPVSCVDRVQTQAASCDEQGVNCITATRPTTEPTAFDPIDSNSLTATQSAVSAQTPISEA